MGQPVVHFEIGCRDRAKTGDFYRQFFAWNIPGGIPGHITSLGHEPHHYTIFFVQVDDVAALAQAVTLGAKTVVPPVPIPTGTFAWFQVKKP